MSLVLQLIALWGFPSLHSFSVVKLKMEQFHLGMPISGAAALSALAVLLSMHES